MKYSARRLLTLAIFLMAFSFLVFRFPAKTYAAASLSLSPATASKNIGDAFAVDIVLDTGGDAVSGATAMLNYDTSKLQVTDDDPNTTGVQIQNGSIFNQVLTNTVDATAGTIRFDAGGLGGSGFTGRGTIATIHFKGQGAGIAQVSFVFNPNSTTNTSQVAAAASPTNLLTTVNNGTYTIGSSTSSSSSTTTSSSTSLPKTGALENTILALFGGISFLAAGIYLARKALLPN